MGNNASTRSITSAEPSVEKGVSTQPSEKKKKKKKKQSPSSKKTKPSPPPPSPPYNGTNLAGKAAMAWVSAKNRHDVMSLYSSATSDCIFHFIDSGVKMPARVFAEHMLAIFDAFPDLHFAYDRLDIIDAHTAILVNYFGKGTHTGTSFEFPPSPAIPAATGFEIADEPIEITFHADDRGKIIDCRIDAHGKVVGPPGFYMKLSNKLAKQQKKAMRQQRGQLLSI